ncbi:hypothetical protein [Phaeodactylibacter xiamenensis]|uniref:hypothetical protein n=1 Tax=Phaeodactylibacter xiamenensis TaxID=1524460 RepID=UPI0024A7BB84|nr:hypothetical protein [Phaeodactylibacter xiamenensis]
MDKQSKAKLEVIARRRNELAGEREQLSKITREEQDLEYQEFKIKMGYTESLGDQAKALETEAVGHKDLRLTVEFGDQQIEIDMSRSTTEKVADLSNISEKVIRDLAMYQRQLGNGFRMLHTSGNVVMQTRYNEEKRKAEQARIRAEAKQTAEG